MSALFDTKLLEGNKGRMALRKASTATTKVSVGGDDYLECRTALTKREFNKILDALPAGYTSETQFTPGESGEFTAALFGALVVGWSSPDPCTVDEYLALDIASAVSVDEALMNHFNSLAPNEGERKSGEGVGEEAGAGREADRGDEATTTDSAVVQPV